MSYKRTDFNAYSKHPANKRCWTQYTPITLHEAGSTWLFILENLSVPVVISEWHVVEVLTQTLLQAYKAGWD